MMQSCWNMINRINARIQMAIIVWRKIIIYHDINRPIDRLFGDQIF
jgi:hypothetical protein